MTTEEVPPACCLSFTRRELRQTALLMDRACWRHSLASGLSPNHNSISSGGGVGKDSGCTLPP